MPIALYYKAILNEYTPDLRRLGQDETLHFSSDYPRRAVVAHLAASVQRPLRRQPGIGGGPLACGQAARQPEGAGKSQGGPRGRRGRHLEAFGASSESPCRPRSDSLFSAFRRPPDTVMTPMKLRELQGRIYELQTLLSDENLAGADGALERLAAFVMLNPYSLDYESQLDFLLTADGRERRPA